MTYSPPMPWLRPFAKGYDQDEQKRIEELAKRLEPRIRKSFLAAVAKLADMIDVPQLIRLLAQGAINAALALVDAALIAAGLAPVAAEATASAIEAGRAAAGVITRLTGGAEFVFGVTNPKTVQHLRAYEMGLVREMTATALNTVREVVTAGVTEGRNPKDVARDVREHIGLTAKQSKFVSNYRKQLEALDRAALARELRDARSDAKIARAIREGKPLDKEYIDKLVARYEARWLKFRAETIARTEAIRGTNSGGQLAWQQAVDEGRMTEQQVRRKWVFTHDLRTRHAHRMIPDMNPGGVGLNEPFKSELGPIKYPGDPDAPAANTVNCRCTVVLRYQP